MITVTPTEEASTAALRAVLAAALPAGTEIDLGQANYVPEPAAKDFVIMTPIRRTRLETNTDALDDCRFIASASGTTLTVTDVDFGSVTPGRTLYGPGIVAGTTVLSQTSGPTGGAGSYVLSASQGTVGAEVMACGVTDVVAPYQLDVQLDFHGDGASSQPADNAQTVAILFRDDWAVQQFLAQAGGVVPLGADDPRQIPFINAEGNYEDRWVVEVHLQVNQTVSVPQQYMDSADVGLIEVDTTYPT